MTKDCCNASVGSASTGSATESERTTLVERALRLEWISVAWMVIESTVAIVSGIAAQSISLIAFGADSVIELISAAVLLWRLTVELKRGREFSEAAERAASRIGGALLFALAAYVVASASWSLWQREGETFSLPGLVVTVMAIPIMWSLSRRKLALAARIGSRALRADAIELITCGYLAVVVVVGLVAQLLLDAWWVDGVTALAIVYFLVKEGREAWEGEECCADED